MPNRAAIARWLNGAPAATDAAYAAATASRTSPGATGEAAADGTAATAGTSAARRGPRARRTSVIAISTAPMNATAGHAEITAPSTPNRAPNATFAPTVAAMPSHSITRASPGAPRPFLASCSSTSDAATISPSTDSGSSRAAAPSCPCARPSP